MTMGQNQTKQAVKSHGEVFTPPNIVFDMILSPYLRDLLTNVDSRAVDPCVGHGQFPAAELVWRLFFNIERLDSRLALRSLYSIFGVDIQPLSIDLCRAHILATFCDAFEFFSGKQLSYNEILFAASIIQHNFIVGDSLNGWADCLDKFGAHDEAQAFRAIHSKPTKRKFEQPSLF